MKVKAQGTKNSTNEEFDQILAEMREELDF